MTTKYIILAIILILDNTLSCEYNIEYNTAICPSLQKYQQYGNPDWHTLKIKNFGNTSLVSISSNTFKRTPNLRILTFQKSINEIHEQALAGLDSLQKLEFFDNDVKNIPGNLLKDSPVDRVHFINSGIQHLGSQLFNQPEYLKIVTIRNNSISHIQDDVFSDSRIEEIYLENNGIEIIDKFAFVNMPKLRRLSLARNKLKDFNLMNLFGTSSNLDRLWLSKNLLTTIKRNMFSGIPQMKYLFLESNDISTVEDGSFNNLHNLIGLDISNNKIWALSPKVFPDANNKMEVLMMQNNRMTFINFELFDLMPKLKFLSIFGNPLQCPCYQDIREYLGNRKITRVCGDNDEEGRPKCIFRNDGEKKCSYDLEQNKKLYFEYMDALKDYAPWTEKCHYAEGYEGLNWVKPPYQHKYGHTTT